MSFAVGVLKLTTVRGLIWQLLNRCIVYAWVLNTLYSTRSHSRCACSLSPLDWQSLTIGAPQPEAPVDPLSHLVPRPATWSEKLIFRPLLPLNFIDITSTTTMSEAVLSKKQQKALAFRAKQKQKAKGLPEPEDVPENDLVDDNDDAAEASTDSKAKPSKAAEGKKRKRDDDTEAAADGEDDTAKDGKKAAKKGKTAWDDEEEKKKTKKDIKQRFILFIGMSTRGG